MIFIFFFPCIPLSFQEMADYIAYVAKDIFNLRGQFNLASCGPALIVLVSMSWKSPLPVSVSFSSSTSLSLSLPSPLSVSLSPSVLACHILECPRGRASEVINSIGRAFERRFHTHFRHTPALLSPNTRSSLWTQHTALPVVINVKRVIRGLTRGQDLSLCLIQHFLRIQVIKLCLHSGQWWECVIKGLQRTQTQTKRRSWRVKWVLIAIISTWKRRHLVVYSINCISQKIKTDSASAFRR